jgi:colanic acid biosynthesis glycosyl transferase WcaI
LWVPEKPTGFKRILHLLSFALSSFPAMLWQTFWKPDVIFVVEPALFCAPAALLTARLSGARAWLHVQDFEVDAAFDLDLLSSKRVRAIVLWLEALIMSRFDRVSSISGRMLERLSIKGVRLSRQLLFPNWVDVTTIRPEGRGERFRSQLGIGDDTCVVLYSGSMGKKQGLEVLLEAAHLLEPITSIKFVLCGEGGARDRLYNLGAGLSNVVWLSLQPMDLLNELLNLADIHVLPQRADVADLVMPSKLTGMLASGRPIIATAAVGTQVANVLENCGMVTEPGNAQALAAAIRLLANDSVLRTRLGYIARQFAENHLDKRLVLARFEQDLQRL